MNYATLRPIIEQLQRDERIEIFLTSTEDSSKTTQVFADACPPCRLISPGAASLYRFDAYLAADFIWLTLPRGTRRVQTFHGVAGKFRTEYDGPTRPMIEWDRFFFINRRRLDRFVASGAVSADSPAVHLVGMPRVDCLVDGSLQRDTILRSLDIDPVRQTVLYAPTWTEYSSLHSMGEDVVRRLGAAGFAVIVKLHDRSRAQWSERLEVIARATGGVVARGADASQYLAASDVMVTDHSSVAFEFLLLDRPVIRIHVPELIARTDIEPTYVELLASASASVTTAPQVVTAVQHAFDAPRVKREERALVAEEMFYRPGTATERAVRNIYELVELQSPRTADSY